MDKEKQIEEMAELIHEAENNRCYHSSCRDCKYGGKDDDLCTEKVTAEYLYEAGYRKQVEGEWVKQVKVARKNNLPPLCYYQCSLCGVYLVEQASFCPNCGAKMKGE